MTSSSPAEPDPRPAWAAQAVENAARRSAASSPSILSYQRSLAWPLFLDAAVVATFRPDQLARGHLSGEARADAEADVLRFSERRFAADRVFWELKPECRRAVLNAEIGSRRLLDAIERTIEEFTTLDDRTLRMVLIDLLGQPRESLPLEGILRKLDAPSELDALAAIRFAVERLGWWARLPRLEEVDRRIVYLRLIAQFERTAGSDPVRGSAPSRRYFVGREADMEALRNYVGVIAPETWSAIAARVRRGITRAILGQPPISIWGVGGMGKTTLMAKFMLDHARSAELNFPFAYLDFDRPTLSPRRGDGLLAEMCSQVAAQFESLAGPLSRIRADLTEFALGIEPSRLYEINGMLGPFVQRFRSQVERHLRQMQSWYEWDRPFLLVFDTFEIVQYSQADVELLELFVELFSGEEGGLWPRLRLVIAGRQVVKSFLGTTETRRLEAIDPQSAMRLLVALARDAEKPISETQGLRLIRAVAKAVPETNGGLLPLRVQLLGEVFRSSPGDGASIAQSLTQEIQKPLQADGLAASILIDGILVRRILDHVRDSRVRALTDPGLVVRRISSDVIQHVMVPGSRPPGDPLADDEAHADDDPTEPWKVDRTEADSIFDAFTREVSLVEPYAGALRHRPDVREQMLPLIKARRPKRFKNLHKLAHAFFVKQAHDDPSDLASLEEAIYHGLHRDVPIQEINALWMSVPGLAPRIEMAEFGRQSKAHAYLRAKAKEELSESELASLPADVAMEWLDARALDLLESPRVDRAIQAILAAAGEHLAELDDRPATAAVLARLMYRAGRWNDSAELTRRHLTRWNQVETSVRRPDRSTEAAQRTEAMISLLRINATIVAKNGGPEDDLLWAAEQLDRLPRDLALIEVAAHVVLGLTQADPSRRDTIEQVRDTIRKAVTRVRVPWQSHLRVLRLVGAVGIRDKKLMVMGLDSRSRVPRDVEPTIVADLLGEIVESAEGIQLLARARRLKGRARFLALDEIWRNERESILRALRKRDDLQPRFWNLILSDHSDWLRPLGNALSRAIDVKGESRLLRALERADFVASKRPSHRTSHGSDLVQSVADEGRLLVLAEFLAVSGPSYADPRQKNQQPPEFPDDVFRLSKALLQWHQITVTEARTGDGST